MVNTKISDSIILVSDQELQSLEIDDTILQLLNIPDPVRDIKNMGKNLTDTIFLHNGLIFKLSDDLKNIEKIYVAIEYLKTHPDLLL